MSARIIGVLGMHRSGTSCLMASLQRAGVFAGAVTTRNPGNEQGNRENVDVWLLHEKLLEAGGGNWSDPPEVIAWSAEHRQHRDLIVQTQFRGRELWGFKDPRLVFTLDGWLEAFPQIELIGTFRHPLAVAQSLHRRDSMPQQEALRLWQRYNERLLRRHDERGPFPMVSFDLERDAYVARVGEILTGLGLSAGQTEFEPSLRHHYGYDGASLPAEIAELYERLCAISG